MEPIINEFRNAMGSRGLLCNDPLIADGELHRFRNPEDAKPNSWYVLYSNKITVGVFGCWKRGIKEKWLSAKNLQKNDRQIIQHCLQDAKEKYKINRDKIQDEARKRAEQIWERSRAVDSNHDYLRKKQIKGYGIRCYNNLLVIPLNDPGGLLWSLQFIQNNGTKRFYKEARKKGYTMY